MSADDMYDEINYEISTKGYSVIGVVEGVPFYYTVGALKEVGFELYLEAVDPTTAETMLDSFINVWKSQKIKSMHDAYVIKGLAKYGYRVGLVEVDDPFIKSERALYASAHNKDASFQVFQLAFPDASNYMPWEDGFDSKSMSTQTIFRNSITHGTVKNDSGLINAQELDFTSVMRAPTNH